LTKVCSDRVENVENRQIWSKEKKGKNDAKLQKPLKLLQLGKSMKIGQHF
jgi:hypothetical protein